MKYFIKRKIPIEICLLCCSGRGTSAVCSTSRLACFGVYLKGRCLLIVVIGNSLHKDKTKYV